MNEVLKRRIAVSVVVLLTAYGSEASADGCRTEDEQAAAAQFRKAEDTERAGKLADAFAMLGKIDDMCLAGDAGKRADAMHKRIGLQLGQQEEKKGNLKAAFDWYQRSRNDEEADRVKMKQVNASSRDRNVVSGAIDHFRYRNNDARVAELRQLAAKNAELELANEEKAFAARKESFTELGNAKDWFYYVSEGAGKKVRGRAEHRGDALLKEDTYRHLENARRYFETAEAKPKVQAVIDKATRLAQQHEKKGEISQAANFYRLAGADAKGEEIEKRAEAQHQEAEGKRQEKFKQEQDDLEKELGL